MNLSGQQEHINVWGTLDCATAQPPGGDIDVAASGLSHWNNFEISQTHMLNPVNLSWTHSKPRPWQIYIMPVCLMRQQAQS